MITLPETPRLVWPTTSVRVSYLTGEQADCLLRGDATDWLGPASEDFARFVLDRRGVRIRWEVEASRRVILANGGTAAGSAGGEEHYWIQVRAAGEPRG